MLFYTDGSMHEIDAYSVDYKKIHTIVWQNTSIDQIPEMAYSCVNMTVLDLSHNKIVRLDTDNLRTIKTLKKLYLNGNPIADEEIDRIKKALPNVEIITSKNEGQK